MDNLRHPSVSVVLLMSCFFVLLLSSQQQLIKAQTVETDEQFEAYHHDIGRINPSSPTSSHVSPASIVKQVAQQQQSPSIDDHNVNAPIVPPVTVPARQLNQHHHQQQQSRSRLRSSQSAAGGLSRLRTTSAEDSPVPARVPLAAAPVPVVVPPSSAASSYLDSNIDQSSSNYNTNYNNQRQQYNEQPALASFRQSSPIVASVASQQQQFNTRQQVASYQPTFSSLSSQSVSQSAYPQHQSASTNNAAYLKSYPSSSIASSPVETLSPQLPPSPVASSIPSPLEPLTAPVYSQVEPIVAATIQQQASNVVGSGNGDQITAPSYEHVLSHGCPHHGVFSYPHADHCDRYYMCTNGTFTEEACPNGLSYGTQGAVYQHCAYRWNIDCGKKRAPGPISSPGCPWQFGVFPASGHQCSIHYHECEWGVPEVKTCHPEGLFYDERIKGCQWADQLGCKSESLLNFKCPHEDEDNSYWPFPRYYHSKTDVIVCVNEQPRLVHCSEDQIVDPSSLACLDTKKKKKKF